MNRYAIASIFLLTVFLYLHSSTDAWAVHPAQPTLRKIMIHCSSTSDESAVLNYNENDLRPRKVLYQFSKKAKTYGQGQCVSKRTVSSSKSLTSKRFWQRISNDNATGRCLESTLSYEDWNNLHELLRDSNIAAAYSSEPHHTKSRLSDNCSYFDYKFYLKSGVLIQFSFDYSLLPRKTL